MVIEVSRRLDAIETVVAVFNEAMAIQEIYLKKQSIYISFESV